MPQTLAKPSLVKFTLISLRALLILGMNQGLYELKQSLNS